jgi:hypothetical protein
VKTHILALTNRPQDTGSDPDAVGSQDRDEMDLFSRKTDNRREKWKTKGKGR